MIEGVDSGRTAGVAAGGKAPAAGAQARPAASFQAVMSEASAAEERMETVRRKVRPPRGERWEAVPGRSDYADVVSGPRNGYYVNLQDGPRQGQVFHMVRKDGRELHIYGEGRDRQVIEVARSVGGDRPVRDPDKVRPREGETFEPVAGHRDYRRIEGGERDDLFVNTSGNERTGRTFRIDERDGGRFHVYGSGPNALEIRVGWRRERETGGGQPPAGDRSIVQP